MGVTYYKLEQRYEGDVTKGCGLTSAEVDANFHFLRGYDIKNATFSDSGILTLERVNCEKIVIEGIPEYVKSIAKETMDGYDEPFNLSGSTFDPETGILTITVNGNPYTIQGFLTNENFRIYVGYGLDGQGTIADPVRISHITDTGFFAPVEKIIDYERGESLPAIENGEDNTKRYITREAKSPYGLAYTYSAVRKISQILEEEGHGWRVPTLDDWNAMLNGQEDCDGEFLNHANTNESSINGKLAGQKLKDYSWFEDTAGENTLNILPLKTELFPYEGNLKTASFWASTVSSADTHVYGKRFIEGADGVETLGNQTTNNYLSLRLVRDAEWGNESETEFINGVPYSTTILKTYKKNDQGHAVFGTSVWTVENVSFNDILQENNGEAIKPFGGNYIFENEEDYNATLKWGYYLNYWDGFDEKWVKKELKPNDLVMVHDFNGEPDTEVIVKIDNNGNSVLIPRSEELFSKIRGYVDSAVTAEAEIRDEKDAILLETISAITSEIEEFSASTVQEIARVDSAITSLEDEIRGVDDKFGQKCANIESAIAAEAEARRSGDTALADSISEEAQIREANDIIWDATPQEVKLGLDTDGLTIRSNNGQKIVRTFNLNMGEINIKDII